MPVSPEYLDVCTKCKALCCNLVLPPVTEEERNMVLEAGFPDYFTKVDINIYAIKPGDKGQCPYLKDDYSCEIHQIKPIFCKIWPVIPRDKDNKRGGIIIKCPLYPLLSKDELEKAKKEGENVPLACIHHLWNISEETKQKYKVFEYEEF